MAEILSQRINLLKLKNAAVIPIKGKTATKKCVVIPIEDNHIFYGQGAYLDTTIVPTENSQYGDSHFVRLSVGKEAYEKMSEEERRAIPIIGNCKPIARAVNNGASDEYTGSVEQTADDLPF